MIYTTHAVVQQQLNNNNFLTIIAFAVVLVSAGRQSSAPSPPSSSTPLPPSSTTSLDTNTSSRPHLVRPPCRPWPLTQLPFRSLRRSDTRRAHVDIAKTKTQVREPPTRVRLDMQTCWHQKEPLSTTSRDAPSSLPECNMSTSRRHLSRG
ncbi:hypothetical protein HDK64DRAFT_283886 [Phyllosticta capitalensis]